MGFENRFDGCFYGTFDGVEYQTISHIDDIPIEAESETIEIKTIDDVEFTCDMSK